MNHLSHLHFRLQVGCSEKLKRPLQERRGLTATWKQTDCDDGICVCFYRTVPPWGLNEPIDFHPPALFTHTHTHTSRERAWISASPSRFDPSLVPRCVSFYLSTESSSFSSSVALSLYRHFLLLWLCYLNLRARIIGCILCTKQNYAFYKLYNEKWDFEYRVWIWKLEGR